MKFSTSVNMWWCIHTQWRHQNPLRKTHSARYSTGSQQGKAIWAAHGFPADTSFLQVFMKAKMSVQAGVSPSRNDDLSYSITGHVQDSLSGVPLRSRVLSTLNWTGSQNHVLNEPRRVNPLANEWRLFLLIVDVQCSLKRKLSACSKKPES